MRSSSGAHFIAPDYFRAFAAFIVFAQHFTHAAYGYPVAFDYVPAPFPFSVLDKGHTGVAFYDPQRLIIRETSRWQIN